MKITVRACAWYDHGRAEECLQWIRSFGFEGIDVDLSEKKALGLEENPTLLGAPLGDVLSYFAPLKEAAEKTDTPIRMMHASVGIGEFGDEDGGEQAFRRLRASLALCQDFGCPAIVVHPTHRPTREAEFCDNLAFYRRMIPLVKEYPGVKVCMENLFRRKLGRIFGMNLAAADWAQMIDTLNEEAGRDAFGFCFDTGHAILGHLRVREFLLTLGHRVIALHLHDNNTEEDLHFLPYSCQHSWGNPYLDWQEFTDTLRDIGYRGDVNFETTRTFIMFPEAVRPGALRLTAALGRYWRECILETKA